MAGLQERIGGRARFLGRQSSRLLYGTDGVIGDNLLVGTRWALARRRRPGPACGGGPAGGDLAVPGRRTRHDGWEPLPARDPEVIAEAVRAFDRIIDVEGCGYDMGHEIRGAVRYLDSPQERIPEVRRLLDEDAQAAVAAYYGTWFRLLHVRMWRISHVPAGLTREHHFGNLWHTDPHPITTVKIFVQLSDVGVVGGAFRFYDLPTTKRVLRPLPGRLATGPDFDWRRDDLPDHVRLFDGPPGSAVLINTCRCLHRAGIPSPGKTRRMLQFTFDLSDLPTPQDLFADLPPDRNVGPDRYA